MATEAVTQEPVEPLEPADGWETADFNWRASVLLGVACTRLAAPFVVTRAEKDALQGRRLVINVSEDGALVATVDTIPLAGQKLNVVYVEPSAAARTAGSPAALPDTEVTE